MTKPLLSVSLEADGLVPRDADGNRILSRTRRGENASLDEAVAMLTGAHRPPPPDRPDMARDDAGRFSRKQITRREFDALPPIERTRLMREGRVELVDG
jgi:hypothetical protein